jgi:putative radical SAM enzyme (TIGR03279 family)
MPRPTIVAVAPGSPAERAGFAVGDLIRSLDGREPRDVIEYHTATDGPDVLVEVDRGGLAVEIEVEKAAGEPLGLEVQSAIFDQVRTCDNHCAFCFIHQLPPGMRSSLSLKDDDYRLSFLYGNFTTLTRFTEADLERVVTDGLGPLYVSIHATDPEVRAQMLRNRRGATSLRWLRALLDHGIVVHGQVVVCPGVNDGAILDDTLCGVLDRFPELNTCAVVPLGVSDYNTEPTMRPHRRDEAAAAVDVVDRWQETFMETLGRPLVFAADEYYLMAGRPFPPAERYGTFELHEDGVGMARSFELEFTGGSDRPIGPQAGFFHWVDGVEGEGYRAPRTDPGTEAPTVTPVALRPTDRRPIGILTGPLGAGVLAPLLENCGRDDVRLLPVANRFFGGNVGVSGLMVGVDIDRVLADQPEGHRYLVPDVCLSRGRFLDDTSPADLCRPVEVVETHGIALREALRG